MNKFTKIKEILSFSDIHPSDCRFILNYILVLERNNNNEELKAINKQVEELRCNK